ncbi:RidA family protein [Luteimicrobium subarcticum]|uniref:Enamine deaminase RidA (YjgF/YER057c/UK114 family) n=1 Tax=Luteimicrobium subarcticum TaxID=620910 RepID=A0A2M8WW57_9MICO|nr:RidA family protein [Luteimicrobium subarcticum]PJI95150.1 enamine deaminase RidA (YjgF/YER057c/UK114 family) [Luteimicrobium subarcticum]
MGVEARLAELGVTLPEVAAPVAAYVPAVRSGNLVHVSGQLPFVDGKLAVTGKVGEGPGLVAPADAAELARVCVLNALAAVRQVVGTLDGVRIVRIGGYVASDPSFTGQPLVLNGASLAIGAIFDEAGIHARSAVGVASLPLDAPVEVEMLAEVAEG